MTRIERYEDQIRKLEAEKSRLVAQRNFVKSIALQKKIDDIKKMVAEMKDYVTPRPLSETVTHEELKAMNIIPLMIECHLIADFLTEVCYMVKDTVKKHGFDKVSFVPELEEIIEKSDSFASFLVKLSPELRDLLLRNQTFNASLHKKFINHIEQRLEHYGKGK